VLSTGTASHPGWLVFIDDEGSRQFVRPAVFVFETPTGFLWIEPGFYNEPGTNSAPQMHSIDAVVTQERPGRWSFAGERSGSVLRYDFGEDADLVGDCLEWFANEFLPGQKKTLAELRASVAEQLRSEQVEIL
jgi:hypothetical protein